MPKPVIDMRRLGFKWVMPDGKPTIARTLMRWKVPNGKPGPWTRPIPFDRLEPCVRGYHLCDAMFVPRWEGASRHVGPRLYLAEYRGGAVRNYDKFVVGQARLLTEVEVERNSYGRIISTLPRKRTILERAGLIDKPVRARKLRTVAADADA
jgi:hypothetical protein